MKNTSSKSEASILRKKAEELMKMRPLKTISQLSEPNSLKLIHELEVHQIELEIQKEELELVKTETNAAIQKYIELYDFAPSGYYTLSKEGEIIELNLLGANMLAKERSHLKNSRFGFSISWDTRPIFNLFLAKVFNSKSKETCEVTLSTHDNLSMYVQLTGITAENGEYCFVTAVDITERKQAEETLHESEARLDEAMKIARLGTWEYDVDRDQFKFNDQFYTLLHTTAEREGGYFMSPMHYAQKFLHPDDMALVGVETQKALETTDPNYYSRLDHRLICADGEIVHITVNIRIVKDSHGRTVKTYGVNQDITERKRIEESLRFFRTLLDKSNDAIEVIDMETGQFIDVNERACTDLGYSRSELLEMKVFDIDPNQTPASFQLLMQEFHQSNSTIIETIHRHRDGSTFPVEVNVTLVKLEKMYTIAIVRDITERKRAEEELQFRNVILSTEHEASIDGILVVDEKAKIISYNHRFVEMWDVPLELVEKKADGPVLEFIMNQVADSQSFLERVQYLYEHKYDICHDEIVLKNGLIFDRYSAQMVGLDDRYYGRVWFFRDITERKRAEETLLENEAKYRTLVTQSPDGIFIVDLSGAFLSVNKTMCDNLKYSEEEFLTMKLWDIIPLEYMAMHKNRLADIIKGERKNEAAEYEVKGKDGISHSIEVLSAPYYKDKAIIGFQGIARDITRRKHAEKELIEAKNKAEESDRLKSTFLANMSHEVRTPLNSIIGFSELLDDPDFEEDQKNDFIHHIITNGNNLLAIISDIMDISKMESGEITIRKRQINAQKFIAGIKEQFAFQTEAKKLELRLILPDNDEETVFIADADRLNQIFNSLISNALKFTAYGRIEIGYQPKGTTVEFYVMDTGIGIAAEYQQIIFERFRQVETSTTRKFGGNGLGLAISKKLVELMGGKIWLESEPGKGSVFYFTLPT